MSDCEQMWLALRVAWWVLGCTSALAAAFFAGYQRGRRSEAEE